MLVLVVGQILHNHGTALADFDCAPCNVCGTPCSGGYGDRIDNFFEDPRRTSIDMPNDSVMKSERNALLGVSDPP